MFPRLALAVNGRQCTLTDERPRQSVDFSKKKGVYWTSVNALGRYFGGGVEPCAKPM
jgi:hypothetical protein